MKQRVSMACPGSEYEAFLFAPLGDDSKGTPLAVASILGRLSLDPWNEAASLAALPADVAARKLASIIEAMPNQRLEQPEAATLAARLIKLLPTHPKPAPPEPGPIADRSTKVGRRPVVYLIWIAIVCILLVGAAFASVAPQTDAGALPSHAHASRYGGGWECLQGYDRHGQTCVAIEVPPNGYLNASRNRWDCSRGYLKSGKQCVAVKVPDNAYADDSPFGTGWRCNRGYRETEKRCTAIVVPANAYPVDSTFGRGWECNRGFRAVGEACAAVKVPANGFLARGGDDWQCERGFVKHGETCAAVEVPPNAYLDGSGNGWQCERGFRREETACTALRTPPNAYVDFAGNNWTCAEGFHKQEERCTAD